MGHRIDSDSVPHSKSQVTFLEKETLAAKSLEVVHEGRPFDQLGWERLRIDTIEVSERYGDLSQTERHSLESSHDIKG
jgi:hypothetical protein